MLAQPDIERYPFGRSTGQDPPVSLESHVRFPRRE